MKKRTLCVIFAISVLLLYLSFSQACGKKKVEVEEKVTIETEEIEEPITKKIEKEPEQIQEQPKREEKVYELQIVASKNYASIELEKNKLELYGYKTKITTHKKDGFTFYRLRLDDFYTHSEATSLGEKLKEQFPSINEYWVQKVK